MYNNYHTVLLEINSITPPNHTLSKNIKLQLEEEINHMLDQIMNIIN